MRSTADSLWLPSGEVSSFPLEPPLSGKMTTPEGLDYSTRLKIPRRRLENRISCANERLGAA